MKTSKVILFLAFIFCVALSQTVTAAVSQSDAILVTSIAKSEKANDLNLKTMATKQFAKVLKFKKNVKNLLKAEKENASNSKLLLLAIVGLALIGVGGLLGSSFLYGIGGIVLTIAVVWWILQLVGVV